MRQFLKFMLASMVGFFLSLLICLFIITAIISTSISSLQDDTTFDVSNHSVLELKLDYPIVERGQKNPFENLNIGIGVEKQIGLNTLLASIKKAEVDSRIDGIFLNLSSLSTGMASAKEIHDALIRFKKSGKFLYAYSESYSQGAYYIASAADSIFLQPTGGVDFHGLGANLMFLKGTLEKLEVEPEIIRHGKFKSAVEPFLYDKMSKENREQTTVFVHSIWNNMISDIAQSRKIDAAEVQRIADQLGGRRPEMALENKLIDRIAYYDEVLATIRKQTGRNEKDKIKFVSLTNYEKSYVKTASALAPKIAIIYAYGDIVSGKGSQDEIGSDRIADAIRKAGRDSSIKAIVFRVNSPGGSALASDVILREAILAKKAKPFIVSMGDYAASGGYYISCASDAIVAEPTTITGSIGVFGLLLNAQKMLNNKLGITFDTVKTARMPDIGTITRPITEEERTIMQDEVERVYATFLTHVANGRNMTNAQVDSIGQGRVWSGVDAKALGLVDVLGGIDDAIKIAVNKAKLTNYRTIELPEQKDFLETLMEDLNTQAGVKIAEEQFGEMYSYYKMVHSAIRQQGILARVPFSIEWK